MKRKPRIDRRALLREAIAIIAPYHRVLRDSYTNRATGVIDEPRIRKEFETLGRWLKQARKAAR